MRVTCCFARFTHLNRSFFHYLKLPRAQRVNLGSPFVVFFSVYACAFHSFLLCRASNFRPQSIPLPIIVFHKLLNWSITGATLASFAGTNLVLSVKCKLRLIVPKRFLSIVLETCVMFKSCDQNLPVFDMSKETCRKRANELFHIM